MFTLLQRGPQKIFYYRFQIQGRSFFVSTGTSKKGEAEEIARKAYDEARAESRAEKVPCTMKELVTLWLKEHRVKGGEVKIGLSEKHWKAVENFRDKLLYGNGDTLITHMTTDIVKAAWNQYSEWKSPASANNWLRLINLIGHYAVEIKMIKALPWVIKKYKIQRNPRQRLPDGLVKQWLDAASAKARKQNRWAIMTCLRLMVELGLRESEALNARWEYIDWERKLYCVGRLVNGLFTTKGGEADTVPMPSSLAEYLATGKKDSGLILPDEEGNPHPTGFCRKAIAAANKACGTPGISPHRLRSSFATSHHSAGTPLGDIQKMLRHKNISTTMEYVDPELEVASQNQEKLSKKRGL